MSGTVGLCVRYGAKAIEFEKGKTADRGSEQGSAHRDAGDRHRRCQGRGARRAPRPTGEGSQCSEVQAGSVKGRSLKSLMASSGQARRRPSRNVCFSEEK